MTMPKVGLTYQHLFTIAGAADKLGVSTKTLRRWEKKGFIMPVRTAGNQRRYSIEQIERFLHKANPETYAPLSAPIVRRPHFGQILRNHSRLYLGTLALVLGLVTGWFRTPGAIGGDLFDPGTVGQGGMVLPSQTDVLGLTDEPGNYTFAVNIPAIFQSGATFVQGLTTTGGITIAEGRLTAPNIVYSLIAAQDSGLTITGSQTLAIVNADKGSAQKIFKTIKAGDTTFAAGSNTDTLEFSASGGTSVSIDTSGKKVTFTSSSPDYSLSGWKDGGTSVYLSTLTDSVGIGTASPSYKLHVVGTGYVSDTLTAGGALAVTGATTLSGNVTLGDATTDAITFTGRVANGTSLLPDTDMGSDIGSSALRFNNLWVANINSNSSQSFSGQTTFSYAPTAATIAQASVLINPTTSAANGQLLGLAIAGYQRALIDEDGDIILGYSDATSAPATDYPLTIYGHSGTNVSYIDTSGNVYMGTGLSSSGALTITPVSGSNLNIALATTGDFAVNTNQLYVDTSTGNVGIGTTSPGAKLEIAPTAASGTVTGLRLYNSNALVGSGAAIDFYAGDGPYKEARIYTSAVDMNKGDLRFAPSNGTTFTDAMAILNTGNVGIGTTSPTSRLHISGAVTGKALAIFDETGDQTLLTASASGVTKFIIDHSGNVGIGTTPSTLLHAKYTDAVTNAISDVVTVDHSSTGTIAAGFGTGLVFAHGGTNMIRINSITDIGASTGSIGFSTNYGGNGLVEEMRLIAASAGGANLKLGANAITNGNATGNFAVAGSGQFYSTSASSSAPDLVNIGNFSLSSPASGIGGSLSFKAVNANINPRDLARISSLFTTVTQGSEVSAMTFNLAAGDGGQGVTMGEKMRITSGGLVGIGTTAPTSKLHVSGAVTGKALAIFDETGDQALLTASASGVTKFTVKHNGLVDARVGVATYTKAGTISDTDFTDAAVDGLLGFDSTNGRLYIRNAGAWSYIAKTAGFQIPNFESQGLAEGDFLMPYVEKRMSDGAVHGLYRKFDLNTLLATQGAVSFTSDVAFRGPALFQALAEFVDRVVFRNAPTFPNSMGGMAVIPASATTVEVAFAKSFAETPIVTMSLSLDSATSSSFLSDKVRAAVSGVSERGFTIVLDTPVPTQTRYHWVALAVEHPETTVGRGIDGSSATVTTPVPTALPDVAGAQTAIPPATPTPIPSPTASPVPSPESIPEATSGSQLPN